ncbi:hypothetical protein M758_UG140100 [Ceratodon purpureus]|nr:hypothetical protein M758_UG140100 [Ceratodon purpureus]
MTIIIAATFTFQQQQRNQKIPTNPEPTPFPEPSLSVSSLYDSSATAPPVSLKHEHHARNHFICICSHVFTVPISSLAVSDPWHNISPAIYMWVFDIGVRYVGVL